MPESSKEQFDKIKKQMQDKEEDPEKKENPFAEQLNAYSAVKHVIGIVSGKGGVGKSFVTGALASAMAKKGYRVGILDADITGPSIPKMYGLHGPAVGDERGVLPIPTKDGIKVMSINLLVDDEEAPMVWRGPVIAGTVKQFWSEVYWGDIDYLFVDMPPGTGDVPLTVFQSLPVEQVIVVTSPQDLVSLIVKKAYNMAGMMSIPVLGLIENYSYLVCPHCGNKIPVFGESTIDETANELGTEVLAKLPLNPEFAKIVDAGKFDTLSIPEIEEAAEKLAGLDQ